MRGIVRRLGLVACVLYMTLMAGGLAPANASSGGQPPVLAYYYIWYNHSSWDSKGDTPALGRYSSSDISVMREQIELAKGAGIDGFIVSWKHTTDLDKRLANLVQVAQEQNFKLEVIYEGLNYSRQPLPVQTVAGDLKWFSDHYAGNPVFSLFGKPMVIWSGTWMFSAGDIEHTVAPLRDKLLVLASEKNTTGYQRVAASVAGDAYYWSSVNPGTFQGYGSKLRDMQAAVHARHGLWIAPFAPGFDARQVGGSNVVPRNDGNTLRTEYNTAVASSPDALGLISWNEYSENSEVEPSHHNGTLYLRVLRQLTHAAGPSAAELGIDSSDSGGSGGSGNLALPILLLVVMLAVLGLGASWLRRRNGTDEPPAPPLPPTRPRPRRNRYEGRLRAAIRRWNWQWVALILAAVASVALAVGVGVVLPRVMSGQAKVVHDPPPNFMGQKTPLGKTTITVAAAGDIACDKDDPSSESPPQYRGDVCKQAETARLVAEVIHPDAVLALGDDDYPSGSLKGFNGQYQPTWGTFKKITYPVPGNHEYGSPGASGYFAYYGAAAGTPGEGWYSYNLGSWHVVALNSECAYIGGCQAGSPEERWLKADLAAHPAACTLAYWHQPRWSSGTHHNEPEFNAFWQDLNAAGADVVLDGHDHDYERFAPLSPAGRIDPARGIREFVVGTGGATHYLLHTPVTGSQRRIQGVFGVLDLQLQPHGYNWKFVAASGAKVLDSGSAACH